VPNNIGERAASRIRIWHQTVDVPVGVGFVLDDRHVMTCAHVVADALGQREALRDNKTAPPQEVRIDLPGVSPRNFLRAKVLPGKWFPERRHTAATADDPVDDIAVLALEPSDRLPTGTQAVVTASGCDNGERFAAYAVSMELPDGRAVAGLLREQLTPSRLQIQSESVEEAVRPGCSGAAAWNLKRGGISGMVVEMQQERSGLIIPVGILTRVWPSLTPASMRAGATPLRTQPNLRSLLAERLCHFDRTLQATAFESAVLKHWDGRKEPFVCVIAGYKADVPGHCRDRCRDESLVPRLNQLAVAGERVRVRFLQWPSGGGAGPAQRFEQLRNALGDQIGMRGDAQALHDLHCSSGRPLLLSSRISISTFSRSEIKLLKAWGAFWAELALQPVPLPLVHFIVVELPQEKTSLREWISGGGDRSRAIDRMVAALTPANVCLLPQLGPVDLDEFAAWLGELTLPEVDPLTLVRLGMNVRQKLHGQKPARMIDLEQWIEEVVL